MNPYKNNLLKHVIFDDLNYEPDLSHKMAFDVRIEWFIWNQKNIPSALSFAACDSPKHRSETNRKHAKCDT